MRNNAYVFLLVDDKYENLIILKALIKESYPNAIFHSALNGKDALELARSEEPDVILLDIMMPDMNGYEVCALLKSEPVLEDIPVMFVTALNSDKETRLKAIEAGADAFLHKPIENLELFVQLRTLLRLRAYNLRKKGKITDLEGDLKVKNIELQASEERFRLMVESISDTIGITDPDGIIKFRSPNNERLFGIKPQDIIGKSSFDFVHQDDKERLRNEFSVLVNEGNDARRSGEFKYLRQDGSVVNVELEGRNMMGNELIDGILLTFKDITEKKVANRKVEEESEKLKALVESTDDLVWMVNPKDYGLILFNKALYRYFETGSGIKIEKGMRPQDLLKADFALKWKEMYENALQNGAYKLDYGTSALGRILRLSFYPVKLRDEVIGITVVGQDITDLKRSEESLRKALVQNQRILDNLTDSYFQTDLSGKLIMVNPKAYKMFAYQSIDEMIGLPASSLYAYVTDRDYLMGELRKHGSLSDYSFLACRKDGSTFWVSMNAQFLRDETGTIIGTEGLVRDISERKNFEDEIEKQSDDLKSSNKKLKERINQSVSAISRIGELRDVYTAGHQKRVQLLACEIAREMNLSEEAIINISYGALIHDIGKITVSSDILNKPGKITQLEYQIIQTHVEQSYNIVKEIDFSIEVPTMILQHHERLDGSGYPNGLKGDEITLESRILAVADVVEAMTYHRPYRPAISIEVVLKDIEQNKGIKFDTQVVDVCISLFKDKNYRFLDD